MKLDVISFDHLTYVTSSDPSFFLWIRHIPTTVVVVVTIHPTTTRDTRRNHHHHHHRMRTIAARTSRRVGSRLLASVNPSIWTQRSTQPLSPTRQLEFEFERRTTTNIYKKETREGGGGEERRRCSSPIGVLRRAFFLFLLLSFFGTSLFFCSGLVTSWLWDF